MGKFQSKHAAAAFKRRESPEGDSFVVSAHPSGRKGTEEAERRGGLEHRARDKQELPSGDPKEEPFQGDQCPLEVVLPPEKAEGPGQLFSVDDGERAANREGPRGLGKKHLNIDALQCDVSVEDNRQEWTFTLYGFDNRGKATREDMSSLMHTIYEVVDASVNHSGSSRSLRVKLTVSPEPFGKRREGPAAGQDREPTRCRTEGELSEDPRVADRRLSAHIRRPNADPHPCPMRGPYCVDENTERRNHYLDLAGIENYTSRFGPGSPPAHPKQEPQAKASHPPSRSRSQDSDAHNRRSQVLADHTLLATEPTARALDMQPRLKGQEKQFLKSPKGSAPTAALWPQAVPAEEQGGPLAAQGHAGPALGVGARGGAGPATHAGGGGLHGACGPAPRTPPPPRASPPPPPPPPPPVLVQPRLPAPGARWVSPGGTGGT